MKSAVIVFPGSNCDEDCRHVLGDVMQASVDMVWHKNRLSTQYDLIVLPGGFSYGDYLRTGSIARFSPVMQDVIQHAQQGRPVIGICNGFQILLESGLLPGAMLRNKTLSFVCKHVYLKVKNNQTIFTNKYKKDEIIRVPIAHGEGNYYCDQETLKKLQQENRIVFQYCSESGELAEEFNPNGSVDHIAGIINENKNVLGMMPHPERASETVLACDDGKAVWQSLCDVVGV